MEHEGEAPGQRGVVEANRAKVSELFHRLNRLIPENQDIVELAPETKVSEALRLLSDRGFSQAPVVENGVVIGVFSLRSLAKGVASSGDEKVKPCDLCVDEFLEKPVYAHINTDLKDIFEGLDRHDIVLIGQPERLQGLVTPMDVLHYLYRVASPFVLIAEIELSLRALIRLSVTEEQLRECAKRCSSSKEGEERAVPEILEKMSFDHYIRLICHGDNWKHFDPLLRGTKERARAKLTQVRDVRNVIFHFKQDLSLSEYETLAGHRDWILSRVRIAEARGHGGHHEG